MNTVVSKPAIAGVAVSSVFSLGAWSCNNDGSGSHTNPDDAIEPPSGAICVWNQAYQENYTEDEVSAMVANARGCYVLIDPFGSVEARNAISQLKAHENVVGCYISSGTCEDWRDDYEEMREFCVDTPWGEWAGEYFVDEPGNELIALMQKRIDTMATWGCDMVQFDNMDWAFDDEKREAYGFGATPEEAIAYNQTLCDYTRGRGMGCMAKNTNEGAEDFDGVTFESYNDDTAPGKDWWSHDELQGFLDAGKNCIIVHYDEPDCDDVYAQYRQVYGDGLSFICEDRSEKAYRHYSP
jgi:cysteinyl-tRNA synthetase